MIVVIGSRHDAVAADLVARWRGAALLSAEDLGRPGWVWGNAKRATRQWIVDAQPVRDKEVSGVFLRRSSVYPEELITTHRDDRPFLAAESHAFLTFVLATTSARVINPVVDGAFGEEALRPERWTAAAVAGGLSVHPLRVTREPKPMPPYRAHALEVAGDEVYGDASKGLMKQTQLAARVLGVSWATFLFDSKNRLLTVTTARAPSKEAAAALHRLLAS